MLTNATSLLERSRGLLLDEVDQRFSENRFLSMHRDSLGTLGSVLVQTHLLYLLVSIIFAIIYFTLLFPQLIKVYNLLQINMEISHLQPGLHHGFGHGHNASLMALENSDMDMDIDIDIGSVDDGELLQQVGKPKSTTVVAVWD